MVRMTWLTDSRKWREVDRFLRERGSKMDTIVWAVTWGGSKDVAGRPGCAPHKLSGGCVVPRLT